MQQLDGASRKMFRRSFFFWRYDDYASLHIITYPYIPLHILIYPDISIHPYISSRIRTYPYTSLHILTWPSISLHILRSKHDSWPIRPRVCLTIEGVADQTQPVHMQVLFCISLLIGAYPFNLCLSLHIFTFAFWCKAVWCKSCLMESCFGWKDSCVQGFQCRSFLEEKLVAMVKHPFLFAPVNNRRAYVKQWFFLVIRLKL